MAAGAGYAGSLILLSPSFSVQDESRFLRVVDRLSDVFGHLPWSAVLKIIGSALRGPTGREAGRCATRPLQSACVAR